MAKILIVEDDVAFCRMLEGFLKKKNFEVSVAFSGEEALQILKSESFDIVLTDVRLPEKNGTIILQEITEGKFDSKVIMMTGYAEVSMAVDAIKNGAFDYISKPIAPDKLLQIIHSALEISAPESIEEKQKNQDFPTTTFVRGNSEAAVRLDDYIGLVAPTNMSVLIIGESGTGKEVAAKKIHDQSKRSENPFVAVDCGAIPKEIASSEFFGHLKGSFTGAINDKTGHFEAANGGTLFLDEIGNLNYELQVQLLRALQERKVKPVGSNKEIEVDIRVITATNEDLESAVKQGNFREDLYHRLNEFSIRMPNLRDRKEDLMLLADNFLKKANHELEKEILGFEEEVMTAFNRYPWPGNLRELQNVIKRSVLLTSEKFVPLKVLPVKIASAKSSSANEYHLFKSKNEQEMLLDALEKTNGNKSRAARILKVDRKTLYNKLKQYGIKL